MFSSSTSLLKVEESSELNAALPVNSSIACEDVRDRRGGGGEEGRRGGGGGGKEERRGMRVWKDKVEEEEKIEMYIGTKLSVYSPTASIPQYEQSMSHTSLGCYVKPHPLHWMCFGQCHTIYHMRSVAGDSILQYITVYHSIRPSMYTSDSRGSCMHIVSCTLPPSPRLKWRV